MSNTRRAATAIAVTALFTAGVVGLAGPAGAADAPNGCSPAYDDPEPVTLDELLQTPRIVTGLAQGAYTAGDLAQLFTIIDANENDVICLKAVSNLSGNSAKNHGAYYLSVDDKHPEK